jgi:hypothetical protein
MVGSHIPSSLREMAPWVIARGRSAALSAGVAAAVVLALGGTALAADVNIPDPATVGTPIVLFSPATPPAPVMPMRNMAATAPVKQPAARAVPATPLIPPAPVPAKLGPPPAARPALPIETELQPLASPSDAPPDAVGPATNKPPAS